tara:strand:+ start:8712 stop:8945 length:234 start_codon:yes stop_codon:yes gene_type:complete
MTEARKQEYKSVVFAGCSIDSNGVSVCNLQNYIKNPLGVPKAKYQVWSDRHRCYDLFYTLDDAIEKFIQLKNKTIYK